MSATSRFSVHYTSLLGKLQNMPFYFLHVHNALLDAWIEKFSHTSRFKRSDTRQSYRGSHDGQNLIPSGGATLCVSNSNK